MTRAIDANVAIEASIAPAGFQALANQTLVAPALMWSEANSVLHHRQWRGVAVSIVALPPAGSSSFSTGTQMLTDTAVWLRHELRLVPRAAAGCVAE